MYYVEQQMFFADVQLEGDMDSSPRLSFLLRVRAVRGCSGLWSTRILLQAVGEILISGVFKPEHANCLNMAANVVSWIINFIER